MIDTDKYNTLIEMRENVIDIYPLTNERFKYGDIMFSVNSEDFGGLFLNNKHISFEFGKGFEMIDLSNLLEAISKYRRHLKNKCKDDIKN